jgi:hypothetical protein
MTRPPEPNPLASAVNTFLATLPAANPGVPQTTTAAPVAPGPSDLVGAYRQVLVHEAEKDLQTPERVSPWHRFGRQLGGVAISLVCVWLWLLPPAWLAPPPEQRAIWPKGEAGSHLLLINTADAIELFRESTGRLPQGAEVDSVAPSVTLRLLQDGGFELRAPDGQYLMAPPPSARSAMGYELGGGAPEVVP